MPLLEVQDLLVSYGSKQVLNGVTLQVDGAEAVAIIGHNGAGKSTFLKGIFGVARVTGGKVFLSGQDITNNQPFENIKKGIAYMAQGGQVFADLTVDDNLKLGGYSVPPNEIDDRMTAIFDMFPAISRRRKIDADSLSGGERQMLAMGMVLMVRPKLLLLDEPSGALAGNLVQQLTETIRSLVDDSGIGIIIVEQNVDMGLKVADRVNMLENGQVVFSGTPADLGGEEARQQLLGLL
jgi:branched-chain amino acid transport system ATP-binding protein